MVKMSIIEKGEKMSTIEKNGEVYGTIYATEKGNCLRFYVLLNRHAKTSDSGEWQSFKNYKAVCEYLDWAIGEDWIIKPVIEQVKDDYRVYYFVPDNQCRYEDSR